MISRTLCSLVMFTALSATAQTQQRACQNNVLKNEFRRMTFAQFCDDRRTLLDRIFDVAADLRGTYSHVRSIALIVSVNKYKTQKPRLPSSDVDADKIGELLKANFDEVLILRDEYATKDSFKWFFTDYLKMRKDAYTNLRVLFYFVGHGSEKVEYDRSGNETSKGYLLLKDALNENDASNVIETSELANLFKSAREYSLHFLAIINACHAGSFLKTEQVLSQAIRSSAVVGGSHIITAVSSTQLAYGSDSDKTPSLLGSWLIEALGNGWGHADSHPSDEQGRGDNVLTVDELYAFLRSRLCRDGFSGRAGRAPEPNPRLCPLFRILDVRQSGGLFFLHAQDAVKANSEFRGIRGARLVTMGAGGVFLVSIEELLNILTGMEKFKIRLPVLELLRGVCSYEPRDLMTDDTIWTKAASCLKDQNTTDKELYEAARILGYFAY